MQKSSRRHVPWTNREIAKLKQLYPTMTRSQLADQFSNRSLRSVISAAAVHGLKKALVRRDQNFWKKISDAHVYQIGCFKPAPQGQAAGEAQS